MELKRVENKLRILGLLHAVLLIILASALFARLKNQPPPLFPVLRDPDLANAALALSIIGLFWGAWMAMVLLRTKRRLLAQRFDG